MVRPSANVRDEPEAGARADALPDEISEIEYDDVAYQQIDMVFVDQVEDEK